MTAQKESSLGEKYRFRGDMVAELYSDVIGPGGGDQEIIAEAPLDRYVVGVLWPSGDKLQEEPEPDGVEPADKEPTEDSPVAQARMRYPTSMGLTFSVRLAVVDTVKIAIAGARYEGIDAGFGKPTSAKNARESEWQRVSLELPTVVQNVSTPGTFKDVVVDGLELYRYVRVARDGVVTVSVALRNIHIPEKRGLRDGLAWFQVGLTIETESPAIVDRTRQRNLGTDDDLDSAALLYRNMYTFAIGHGCAVEWDRSKAVNSSVARVATTFLPTHDVHRARPGVLDESVNLRMSFLSTASEGDIGASLRGLSTRYRSWINTLETSLENGTTDVSDELIPTATRHVEAARVAARRIDAGIELLAKDADAMRAFRFANQAMQLQRARQDWVRSGAHGDVSEGINERWYPFQLAYILLNLPGLSDPTHPDRDTADLLWFPTGGGKTEAYLGLVAYCIIHRRLKDPQVEGVAVIMRYTLRLLTIQQFERATMLMCSLETVRRANPVLGGRSFSIGLWVGSGGTPNSLDDARRSLRELKSRRDLLEKNPVQLTQCPWCGSLLDYNNYAVKMAPVRHLHIGCAQPGCDFGEGLPVHVVDEDIYRERPELILGTVDKFAAMAWNDSVGKLFARNGVGLPPDLIIQDELHLISGPLGSMVGLYETAIDAACSVQSLENETNRGRPKVIASTATIRRAEKQIESVFDRTAEQFPPPGIDPDESFFAEPAPPETHGTRQYVGIMAPATSHATLLVRVYAALLQAAKDVSGDDMTRDPYWTLLGYFNSLRVLGSANLQVEGDVRERLGVVATRKSTAARHLEPSNELTSRVASSDIPVRLKRMEKTLSDGDPDDVVLATNMISVGVDIDRLGLMAVMGQPQSSAEYIQATSRVGRKFPGLVVTIFNAARSRDRSHYESFIPYHQALYRAVEATSATPFAARARDRGLHGVLVSLARLLVPGLTDNKSAYLASDNWDALCQVSDILERRVSHVAPDERRGTSDQVDELLKVWHQAGTDKPRMQYRNDKNVDAALLVDPGKALIDESIEYSQKEAPWPTLQSMRDVDAESGLYQIPMRRKS
ncbi:helicase-related protein [Antrihabitans sp. NCIMB 15449]|uniref:Helicase-related protein n=1 Tax=Antrihabitans spumae TaxID=3373370 RepID=A0ABW7JU02_9NOCA